MIPDPNRPPQIPNFNMQPRIDHANNQSQDFSSSDDSGISYFSSDPQSRNEGIQPQIHNGAGVLNGWNPEAALLREVALSYPPIHRMLIRETFGNLVDLNAQNLGLYMVHPPLIDISQFIPSEDSQNSDAQSIGQRINSQAPNNDENEEDDSGLNMSEILEGGDDEGDIFGELNRNPDPNPPEGGSIN